MNTNRIVIAVVFILGTSSCVAYPGALPSGTPEIYRDSRTATSTPRPTPTAEPTKTHRPATETAPPKPTRVEFPPIPTMDIPAQLDRLRATEEVGRVLWSGSISLSVFERLAREVSPEREAIQTANYYATVTTSARPAILAAYFYETQDSDAERGRFLLYELGGKYGEEVIAPFVYKLDLPVDRIAGHESYGDLQTLQANLEIQFESPMLPNFLSATVFSTQICKYDDPESRRLCAELVREGLGLPSDVDAAESLLMNQWRAAMEGTELKIGDVHELVSSLDARSVEWWNDERIRLFALPFVRVCVPDPDGICSTYITYELAVDTSFAEILEP